MQAIKPRGGHTARELVQAVRCGTSLGKAEHSASAASKGFLRKLGKTHSVSGSLKARPQDQAAKAGVPETLRYDLVNLGREAASSLNFGDIGV